MSIPLYSDVISALCHAAVGDTSRRVAGPVTGYRCKATYSLYPPPLATSELAMAQVNALCHAVENFKAARLAEGFHFYERHPKFFFEVCGKVTRRGECMVKVALLNGKGSGQATLFDEWYHSVPDEPQRLSSFMRNRFPELVAIVAHVRLEDGPHLSLKPDKTCAYLPIPSGAEGMTSMPVAVTEYTPNGHAFTLSADSFCEVNQPMEDAIYHAIVEFLRLETVPARGRRAFISGRDVNSVVKTFQEYYSGVTVATTCPNVFADTKVNNISDVHFVEKDKLGQLLKETYGSGSVRCGGALSEAQVLITAGRHGLHPSTTAALSDLAECTDVTGLSDVIYVSCNVESFARDMFVLKQGLQVRHVRSFDFFPGTQYVMTVVHLAPLAATTGSGLLVIPVGPPGAGKSSSGRALQRFFGQECSSKDPPAAKRSRDSESTTNQARCGHEPKAFIPRTFADITSNVRVDVFERDLVFHRLRESGRGLKPSKVAAHVELLATLRRPPVAATSGGHSEAPAAASTRHPIPERRLVYLDSTNGSAEARELYRTEWIGSANPSGGAPPPTLTLWFDCPGDAGASLLRRVAARTGHPCFPADPEAQARKVAVITDAIEPEELGVPDGNCHALRIDATTTERATVTEVIVVAAAFLHFHLSLAQSFIPTAVRRLLGPE